MSIRLGLVGAIAVLLPLSGAALVHRGGAGDAGPGKSRAVEVTARDYTLNMPDTLEAGVTTIRFTNMGADLHHLWLVRLDSGKTMADFTAAMQAEHRMPGFSHDVGGPNAPAPGGGSSNVTVMLRPGYYVALCLIDTKASNHEMHAMKGMIRPVIVVARSGVEQQGEDLPKSSSTVTLADYAFGFTGQIHAGHNVIRVVNKGTQTHELELVQLAPGKVPMDLVNWVMNPDGPPPAKPIGGVSGMAVGGEISFEADLAPGEYGLICFVPDARDGKPHFEHGMMRQITVK